MVNNSMSENPGGKKWLPIILIGGGLAGLFFLLVKKARAEEPIISEKFVCPICKREFDTEAALRTHIESAHPTVRMIWCAKEGRNIPTTEYSESRCKLLVEEKKFCKAENRDIPKGQWTEERCEVKWCEKENKYVAIRDWTKQRCERIILPSGWILQGIGEQGVSEWTEKYAEKVNGLYTVNRVTTIYRSYGAGWQRQGSGILGEAIPSDKFKILQGIRFVGTYPDDTIYHWALVQFV